MGRIRGALAAAAVLIAAFGAGPARAAEVCTLVADAASGRVVLEEGDCASRVTPASTFKVALAVMGFDAGFLKGPHDPVLPFKDGYVAWRGARLPEEARALIDRVRGAA